MDVDKGKKAVVADVGWTEVECPDPKSAADSDQQDLVCCFRC
jgi:hypothetical protein